MFHECSCVYQHATWTSVTFQMDPKYRHEIFTLMCDYQLQTLGYQLSRLEKANSFCLSAWTSWRLLRRENVKNTSLQNVGKHEKHEKNKSTRCSPRETKWVCLTRQGEKRSVPGLPMQACLVVNQTIPNARHPVSPALARASCTPSRWTDSATLSKGMSLAMSAFACPRLPPPLRTVCVSLPSDKEIFVGPRMLNLSHFQKPNLNEDKGEQCRMTISLEPHNLIRNTARGRALSWGSLNFGVSQVVWYVSNYCIKHWKRHK